MMNNNKPATKNIAGIILIGIALRVFFILAVSDFEDLDTQSLSVTDIDYKVYSDAAKCENPYVCHHTYRYSPLLAYLMYYNDSVQYAGKIVFTLFDLVAMIGLYFISKHKPENGQTFVALYSLNPLFIYLTARGSCESISVALMFWTFYLIFQKNGNVTLDNNFNRMIKQRQYQPESGYGTQWIGFALYGLWVHFRVYPIIFCPLIILHFRKLHIKNPHLFWNIFLKFAVISASVFVGLFVLFYFMYGQIFAQQTFFYHLSRLDNRHSFSPFFYDIYLSFNTSSFCRSLPQICALYTLTRQLHKSISPFYAVFLLTYSFVNFNQVITMQYYMWIWSCLILVAPESTMWADPKRRVREAFFLTLQWVFGVMLWVWMSMKLEGEGQNVFTGMWWICILKLGLDLWVLVWFMKTVKNQHAYQKLPSKFR